MIAVVIEQAVQNWMLGLLSTAIIALIANTFWARDRLTNVEADIRWLIRMLGDKAGLTLHSPHTPELDSLIDKFRNREQFLWSEVARFVGMLKQIEEDFSASKGDRLAAGILLMSLEKTYGDIHDQEGAPKEGAALMAMPNTTPTP